MGNAFRNSQSQLESPHPNSVTSCSTEWRKFVFNAEDQEVLTFEYFKQLGVRDSIAGIQKVELEKVGRDKIRMQTPAVFLTYFEGLLAFKQNVPEQERGVYPALKEISISSGDACDMFVDVLRASSIYFPSLASFELRIDACAKSPDGPKFWHELARCLQTGFPHLRHLRINIPGISLHDDYSFYLLETALRTRPDLETVEIECEYTAPEVRAKVDQLYTQWAASNLFTCSYVGEIEERTEALSFLRKAQDTGTLKRRMVNFQNNSADNLKIYEIYRALKDPSPWYLQTLYKNTKYFVTPEVESREEILYQTRLPFWSLNRKAKI